MKASLADQLKEAKLDYSSYGRLPIREDVLVFRKGDEENKDIMKQWEKLSYLQKHLSTIDRYIQHNKGEKIGEWLKSNNIKISKIVFDKIGGHNNATRGISAYFLNLQNFYDQEEEKYDKMEEDSNVPSDMKNIAEDLRKTRAEKRQMRRKTRKLKMRDLHADGKGYLQVDLEEPAVKEEPKTEEKKAEDAVVDAVKKTKKNIGIWVAGTVILVTAIAIAANAQKE